MIKQELYDIVQGLEKFNQKTCRYIWENPEVGGTEKKSVQYYKKALKDEGFTIHESKYYDNSFYGEYGQGKPVIGILAEYDALPLLSQKRSSVKEPVVEGGPGHGCGHNLLGSAGLTAAVALKRFLEAENISGTIRFYGCPEEELLMGKVKMIAEGMFDDCDLALSWHPMDATMTHNGAYLANTAMKFYFSGRTSHAAFAPERGRSALDAVELMSVGCNYLREHVVDQTRIHYTTDSGGFAPNIVPDKASAWYFVRAPKMEYVKDTARRVELVAQGAAIMTETTVRVEHGYGCCEFKENSAFADLNYKNLIEADGPKYTQKELDFAKEIQSTIDPALVNNLTNAYNMDSEALFMGVGDRDLCTTQRMNASSDSGDVSYKIPTGLFTIACWPIGVAPHTWQATASAGSTIGEKGALYAAKVLAGTSYDLFTQPKVVAKIVKEFNDTSTHDYEPMLADDCIIK